MHKTFIYFLNSNFNHQVLNMLPKLFVNNKYRITNITFLFKRFFSDNYFKSRITAHSASYKTSTITGTNTFIN